MTPRSYSRSAARNDAAPILEGMIGGRVGLIEGVRRLADMRHSLFGHSANDADFAKILEFESRTNHLPIGAEREEWEPHALADKDKEIAAAEAAARPVLLGACRALLLLFGAA
jgi:hypothetical protein